jgi:hypothetical protein
MINLYPQSKDRKKADKLLAKRLKKHLGKREANAALRQQTETFWLLQLQLLEMSRWHLRLTFWSIQHLPTYKKNKITHKLSSKVDHTWNYDEETRQCLATHIALQLAGVEE